jgi:hypothetical protein
MQKTGSNGIAAVGRTEDRRKPGIREVWCTLAHDEITWPAHGYYRCRKCGLQFRVPWDETYWQRADGPAARREVTRPETVAA